MKDIKPEPMKGKVKLYQTYYKEGLDVMAVRDIRSAVEWLKKELNKSIRPSKRVFNKIDEAFEDAMKDDES